MDVDLLLDRVVVVAKQRSLTVTTLGEVGRWPLLFLSSRTVIGPSLLLAAGFHGDEPAGCWGLLDFLEGAPDELFQQNRLSFLPCVNPSGLHAEIRCNDLGEDPNRGFCHASMTGDRLSREGDLLVRYIPRIFDGIISLHEDEDVTGSYVYASEPGEGLGNFTRALVDAQRRFFASVPDGLLYGSTVRDGAIYWQDRLEEHDGSFEDYLFHSGTLYTACTETPGRLDFEQRVRANSEVARAFVCCRLTSNR